MVWLHLIVRVVFGVYPGSCRFGLSGPYPSTLLENLSKEGDLQQIKISPQRLGRELKALYCEVLFAVFVYVLLFPHVPEFVS